MATTLETCQELLDNVRKESEKVGRAVEELNRALKAAREETEALQRALAEESALGKKHKRRADAVEGLFTFLETTEVNYPSPGLWKRDLNEHLIAAKAGVEE